MQNCANRRGKEKLNLCEPYGPHFWSDITRIRIPGISAKTKEQEENQRLLRENDASTDIRVKVSTQSNTPADREPSDKSNEPSGHKTSKPNFFTYACYFHSTKTTKKIANAITDISVLIILILYRKWLTFLRNARIRDNFKKIDYKKRPLFKHLTVFYFRHVKES